MKNAYIKIIFLISVCAIQAHVKRETGYFCVPVADLLLKPIHSKRVDSVENAYSSITLQPETGNYSCLRAHQGLFNEAVTVLQYDGDEVQIEIRNCFYDSAFYRERQSKYWTLRKWIVTESELSDVGISANAFPIPIDYKVGYFDPDVITLLYPWTDPCSHITYSAGTRFVSDVCQDNDEVYCALIYDPVEKRVCKALIPKDVCLKLGFTTHLERQKSFVDLLYKWVNYDELCIPYVWGGASFIWRTDDTFSLMQSEKYGEELQAWVRPYPHQGPVTGFDCSCLIMRAAQAVGIPYYYKNTTTVSNFLHPLMHNDTLEDGDLIWSPGHVAVISSVERNEIIEAAGYHSGRGKVHLARLSQRFAHINSFDDLLKAYFNREPIEILNKQGEVVSVLVLYRILKFSTIWQQQRIEKKEMNHV